MISLPSIRRLVYAEKTKGASIPRGALRPTFQRLMDYYNIRSRSAIADGAPLHLVGKVCAKAKWSANLVQLPFRFHEPRPLSTYPCRSDIPDRRRAGDSGAWACRRAPRTSTGEQSERRNWNVISSVTWFLA